MDPFASANAALRETCCLRLVQHRCGCLKIVTVVKTEAEKADALSRAVLCPDCQDVVRRTTPNKRRR